MQTIVIDGHCWDIEFAGFAHALSASTRAGEASLRPESLALAPWSCAQHLEALRQNLRPSPHGVELDGDGYADMVLGQVASGGRGAAASLRPLALWWASGRDPGDEDPTPPPDAEGWVRLGSSRRARVRPWSWGERLAAQRANLHEQGESRNFDPVGYLAAMLRVCVLELDSSDSIDSIDSIDALDSGATRRLIEAVLAVNQPGEAEDPFEHLSPELAAATLRLCAVMGWTLDRVLSSPAGEVQRMLALLARVDAGSEERPPANPRAPRTRGHGRLADHPDAVVILFDPPVGSE